MPRKRKYNKNMMLPGVQVKAIKKEKWSLKRSQSPSSGEEIILTCYTCGKSFRNLKQHKRVFHVLSDFDNGDSGIICVESIIELIENLQTDDEPLENKNVAEEEMKHVPDNSNTVHSKYEPMDEKDNIVEKVDPPTFVEPWNEPGLETLVDSIDTINVICNVCNKTFKKKWNLKRHMIQTHATKPFIEMQNDNTEEDKEVENCMMTEVKKKEDIKLQDVNVEEEDVENGKVWVELGGEKIWVDIGGECSEDGGMKEDEDGMDEQEIEKGHAEETKEPLEVDKELVEETREPIEFEKGYADDMKKPKEIELLETEVLKGHEEINQEMVRGRRHIG